MNEARTQPGPAAESPGGVPLSGVYAAAGASSQEAAQATWIAAFQTAHPEVTINYNPLGSGGGRTQFIEGATVYAGSDSPLLPDELGGRTPGKCASGSETLNLPVYLSPIVVVFSLPGAETLNLDPPTLARIFNGEVTRWDDQAITQLNPGLELPDLPITAVYRSDDSGTTKNFSDYLHRNVPHLWADAPADRFPYSFPGAEGAQGAAGVVEVVRSGTGTIGYADASKAGELATASLLVGEEFVPYSDKAAGSEYPLAMVSYLIVCATYADPDDAAVVRSFAALVASDEGQQAAATQAGSAPLAAETQKEILNAVQLIK